MGSVGRPAWDVDGSLGRPKPPRNVGASLWFLTLDGLLRGRYDHAEGCERLDVLAAPGVDAVAVEDEVRTIAHGSMEVLRDVVGRLIIFAKLVAAVRSGRVT